MYKFQLLFFACLITAGCQTSRIKNFDKVTLGQTKGEVVELAGSPLRTERVSGHDRWTYFFEQPGGPIEQVLIFENNKVSYKGVPPKPFISAEEQDRINQQKNIELQRLEGESKEKK